MPCGVVDLPRRREASIRPLAPAFNLSTDHYDRIGRPKWRNWQTRRTQNPVAFGPCGFDSHLRHYLHEASPTTGRSRETCDTVLALLALAELALVEIVEPDRVLTGTASATAGGIGLVTFVAPRPTHIAVDPRADPLRSHYRDVLRFVRRRVDSTATAEDVTQEVFANAAESLARSAGAAAPNPGRA